MVGKAPRRASRGDRLRESLFDKYAANLSVWFPDTTDIFVCPVCRGGHFRASLEAKPPEVALAHIVPRSLGGGPTTLVCRSCENNLSAAFDRAAADEKRFHEWVARKHARDARASEPEGNVAFEFERDGKHPSLKSVPSRSNPQAREALFERLASETGTSFSVRIQTFHERHRDLSYLYHAFLAMFDAFGYEFAFSREVDRIRGLLLGDDESDIGSILRSVRYKLTDMPKAPPHINVVTSEDHPACFFVALPPLLRTEAARGVILPGPDQVSARHFDELIDNPAPFSGDMQFTWIPRDKLIGLDNPDSRGQMLYIFSEFSRHESAGDGNPAT